MPKRLPKYSRTEQSFRAVANRKITDRSLEIISYIDHYNYLPSSLLVRLVEGNEDITYRHLQTLYHKKLVNRFAFPSSLNPGEFNYYLDNAAALDLLIEAQWAEPHQLDYDRVRYNREKDYSSLHFEPRRQGSLLFLNHELDISRFHFLLEMGCRASKGKVELTDFRQGPELWHTTIAPRVRFDGQQNLWGEVDVPEELPHRPDAFFTLRYLDRPESKQYEHFLYERDRKTTTDRKRIVKKLRAHFHYIIKRRQYQTDYGVPSIKAVLIETLDDDWALYLREVAAHPLVSPHQPTPLFWVTTSRLIELGPSKDQERFAQRKDFFLHHPEIIFHGIWATAVNNQFRSLLD